MTAVPKLRESWWDGHQVRLSTTADHPALLAFAVEAKAEVDAGRIHRDFSLPTEFDDSEKLIFVVTFQGKPIGEFVLRHENFNSAFVPRRYPIRWVGAAAAAILVQHHFDAPGARDIRFRPLDEAGEKLASKVFKQAKQVLGPPYDRVLRREAWAPTVLELVQMFEDGPKRKGAS